MASTASFSTRESTPAMRRHHLLYTCGLSFLAIVDKACVRTQDVNNPIGKMAKKIPITLASALPLIYALQYLWLGILSFFDDQFLAVEDLTKTLFPPSTCVFNKIDGFIHIVECLPEKFDDGIDNLTVMIHQVPFLNWAMDNIVSWLTFLNDALTTRGSNDEIEKEIVIDISYEDHPCIESPSNAQFESPGKSTLISDSLKDGNKTGGEENCPVEPPMPFTKCSYKEILEKGTKDNDEKKENSVLEAARETIVIGKEEEEEAAAVGGRRKMDGDMSSEEIVSKDPILNLFEASWHM